MIVIIIALFALTPWFVKADYVTSPRDTQVNPPALTDIPLDAYDTTGYALLHENDSFIFYWKETLDILAVYDKRIGYLWKSGLDVDPESSRTAQTSTCRALLRQYNNDEITFDDFEAGCETTIDSITGTTTGPLQANSLLYFAYFSKGVSDALFSTNAVYSSYRKTVLYTVDSTMTMVDGDPTQWRFTVAATGLGLAKNLDLTILADVYLTDSGFRIEIPETNISGSALLYLASIGIASYMGAVGGVDNIFTVIPKTDDDMGDFTSEQVQRPLIGGYAFVPDGPGALIRFQDNSVSLSRYQAYVYGDDPSQTYPSYRSIAGTYVPFKTASIPVYGIAHGDDQAAFVAYASSGSEYMQIISIPEENIYKYNSTHAKFIYNFQYNKLFTMSGSNPVPSIYTDLNHFDIVMNYDFLAGDGSLDDCPANYVGMARKYREFLIATTNLAEQSATRDDIGIRVDFLMADAESSIVGYRTLITTDHTGVRTVLDALLELGLKNISSGLIGWQKHGVTLGNPTKATFAKAIGSQADFEPLVADYRELGVDISFYQDYYLINEEQVALARNAAKHPSGWYGRIVTSADPISVFYYARPLKAVEWLARQTAAFTKMGAESMTIAGITSNLHSDYSATLTARTDAVALYREAFADLGNNTMINAVKPNMYLFEYVDRYLLMDVYPTQYLIQTDTVPFLPILLANTMELYAIYSNFSFYTRADMLRLIDYNLYPSFVLTHEPSYLLTHTNSSDYYTTEYLLYKDLIKETYETVNTALGSVIGANWINREVLAPGLIRNTYDNGVAIIINYSEADQTVNELLVAGLDFLVVGGE